MSKGAQRFEVFTGAGKRREWPAQAKASIVAECYLGRDGVGAVARRHGLDPSQVYAWRRDLRTRLEAEGLVLSPADPEVAAFVPAVIEPSVGADPSPKRSPRRRRRATGAAVELEIDGLAVKIGHGADVGTITAVIEALRAPR